MAYVKLRPRRSTRAQWEYANPVLSEGEMGVEVPDTGVGTGLVNFKFGDGVATWNQLPYGFNAAEMNDRIVELTNTVAGYDDIIHQVEEDVEQIERKVENTRKIVIQQSRPESDFVLGEIWIETDIISGSFLLNRTSLDLNVGDSFQLILNNTLSQYDGITWGCSDEHVVELSNKTAERCTVTGLTKGGSWHNPEAPIKVTAYAWINDPDPEHVGERLIIMTAVCDIVVSMSGGVNILPSNLRLFAGDESTLLLNNTITPFDEITWESSQAAIVNILRSDNDKATIKALTPMSTATIIARIKNSGVILDSAESIIDTIGGKFDLDNVSIRYGTELDVYYRYSLLDTEYDDIVFLSSDTSVCSIVSAVKDPSKPVYTVKLHGGRSDNATITAQVKLGGTTLQQDTLEVKVNGFIELDKPSWNAQVGNSIGIVLHNHLNNSEWDTITWNTTDPLIVRITDSSDTGANLTATGPGDAAITATAYLGSNIVSSATCQVSVAGSLTMNETTKTATKGIPVTLVATNTLSSSQYDNVIWSSNNGNIADILTTHPDTLHPSADIQSFIAGTCTITITARQGTNFVASATCTFTVVEP